jgi:glycosyltransferase involved in cell wall biosynthesis
MNGPVMRILEVNKFFHERRGAERHFLDVTDLLSSEGHEVAVFSMEHPKNRPAPFPTFFVSRAGFSMEDAGSVLNIAKGIGRLFWSFETRRMMRRALDDFRPDVVHVHNAYHQLPPSFLPIVRKRGIPVIMTVHDYHVVSPDRNAVYASPLRFLLFGPYGVPKRILLTLRACLDGIFGSYSKNVDIYVAPSRFVKETLVHAGIPEEQIRVIPHFVSSFDAPDTEATAVPYALYSGSVSEDKNISELASLFDRIGYPLVLAGRKSMEIREGDFVRYVGEKSREELGVLLSGASFSVSASRLPETFGLSALEANAAGKPFFGYVTGAFPEIIGQGKTGYLAKDADDLERAVTEFVADPACSGYDGPETIRQKAVSGFGRERYLNSFLNLARETREEKEKATG